MKSDPSSSAAAGARPAALAIFAALVAMAAAQASAAPPATQLLKGDQVTEENLVKALTPAPRVGHARSLKMRTTGPGAASPNSASLLITFVTGSAELTPQSKSQLDVVGRAMKSDQLSTLGFTVEGHADPRGTVEGNLVLSRARAESVRDYLVNEHGIVAERLSPVGKGSSELLNTDDPIAPENRRVSIITKLK